MTMNLLNFIAQFSDEESCKLKYKEVRDKVGVTCVSRSTIIDSDNSTSYVHLKDMVDLRRPVVIPKEKVSEMLPWVHLAISNAKRLLLNVHHDIKPQYLQGYFNEFCYKYNRRYFGEKLFDRLLIACVSYNNEF